MTRLLVDVVIAAGFVAACFLAALIVFGLGCDVQRWWRNRHAVEPSSCPARAWGDVDVDWSEWDRRAA